MPQGGFRYLSGPAGACSDSAKRNPTISPDKDKHFIIHAKGDSMMPIIHDGDLCIFEWYKGGSREGEIVLTQSSDYDPDYDGKYTIKRYHSEKLRSDDNWQTH